MSAAEYEPSTYGNRIADVYDDWAREDPDQAVSTLSDLAKGGRALELGIGTGRLALPLSAQGLVVEGIDASKAMVAKLQAKPGGSAIPVTIGNFVEMDVEGAFSLVFVAFNTFFGLLSQNDQVRCFRNVATRLESDGVFVLEVFVPDMTRFQGNRRVSIDRVELDRVRIDVEQHDPREQRVLVQMVMFSEMASSSILFSCVTHGQRNSTSWRRSQVSSSGSAGATGIGRHSPLQAASTCQSLGTLRLSIRSQTSRMAIAISNDPARTLRRTYASVTGYSVW